MERPQVEIDLLAPGASRYAHDLEHGTLFVVGIALPAACECDLVLFAGEQVFSIPARVAFVEPDVGVGLALTLADSVRARIVELACAAPPMPQPGDLSLDDGLAAAAVEPAVVARVAVVPADRFAEAYAGASGTPDLSLDDIDDVSFPAPADAAGDAAADDDDGLDTPSARGIPKNVYERLRGLTVVEQQRVAREGEHHERVALQRIYGKAVWEALLRNPRITAPEVARIARMESLPRPQLELIVANGSWLGVPEVRRALLANQRLTADMIPRVLRRLPKHELKLASQQIAYPAAVRDAARRMLNQP